MIGLRPVQKIGAGESINGEQYDIDGKPAWRVTATARDGNQATFWAMHRTDPNYPWVCCAGPGSMSHYTRRRDFESAARDANLRARKWLNAGRRMSRLKTKKQEAA